ncbi:MAG: type II toxin-antitoxin system RelE/ParE family toxin [Gammaproteobacteria bacterium]|nr:type II toxin-antitoxin system RelE/ParE family toxin [Gammaproteobacteria bacterium]
MKLRWHGEARAETDAAAAFYSEKQPGLAQRFLDDLEDALHRIQRHPQRSDLIEIITVMHLRRPAGYWKQRA